MVSNSMDGKALVLTDSMHSEVFALGNFIDAELTFQ